MLLVLSGTDRVACGELPFLMPVPSTDLLLWAAKAIGSSGQAVLSANLSQSGDKGPWLLTVGSSDGTVRAVLRLDDSTDVDSVHRFSTEAAAIELAEHHGLAAPRLLASDLDGSVTGKLAILQTALPGGSQIPVEPHQDRLLALGRGLARVHKVAAVPTMALPLRRRPTEDVDFGALPIPERSVELLTTARRFLSERPVPEEPQGLVHGDFWQGNTLWESDRYIGTIDWDCAGVGPPGVDLGSARCDVAMMYGLGAEDEVLVGWEEVMDRSALNVAWWDTVAATCTPPDLSMWLPNFHHQGRDDLDLTTVTRRRDSFLAAALQHLV